MTMRIEIEIKRADLTARMHNQLMREINRGVMERHVAERLPKHFETIAYAEYGARRRQGKTLNKRPNVESGRMKSTLRTKITATQYGSRLLILAKLEKFNPDDPYWKSIQDDPLKLARYMKQEVRRMANWQKREIAVLSRNEIKQERHRQALEYRLGALSSKYKRKRSRRIK